MNIHGHQEIPKNTIQPLLHISFADTITFLPKITGFPINHLLCLSFLEQKIFWWYLSRFFSFFPSKWHFSAISKFTTYHIIFFNVTWFQLLYFVFVQVSCQKHLLKSLYQTFHFISIWLDFRIFLRVGHGSSRGSRDPHEIWP